MENTNNKKDIEIDRHKKTTNAVWRASLMNIPLFAIPAFLALFIGKILDKRFETGLKITIPLLFITFVSSWIAVLQQQAKISKEYKKMREDMKKEDAEKIK
jgi:F0F1-type ATP synthase assembly protein I